VEERGNKFLGVVDKKWTEPRKTFSEKYGGIQPDFTFNNVVREKGEKK